MPSKDSPLPSEVWLPVIGYEGLYEVSSLGRVKSLPGGRRLGKVLKQANKTLNYKCVTLCRDGVSNTQFVHRIVAEVFISNPQGKKTVNHLDGNPENNQVTNLEWATQGENEVYSWKHLGKKAYPHTRKLTDNQIANVLHLRGSLSNRKIAELYGVSRSIVDRIMVADYNKLFRLPELQIVNGSKEG